MWTNKLLYLHVFIYFSLTTLSYSLYSPVSLCIYPHFLLCISVYRPPHFICLSVYVPPCPPLSIHTSHPHIDVIFVPLAGVWKWNEHLMIEILDWTFRQKLIRMWGKLTTSKVKCGNKPREWIKHTLKEESWKIKWNIYTRHECAWWREWLVHICTYLTPIRRLHLDVYICARLL